jgi:hypothetical protein
MIENRSSPRVLETASRAVHIVKDYNFLEEVKQAHESGHRLIGGNFVGRGPGGAKLPGWLFYLGLKISKFTSKFYYAKRRFSITSKCR